MINNFYFKKLNDKFLITNDMGRYLFLSPEEFKMLVEGKVDNTTAKWKLLEENFFVYNGSVQSYVENAAPYLRDTKNYIFTPTSLHIFVVTTKCNLKCVYCQANKGFPANKEMSKETAEKAVDIALSSPSNILTFEFQGGEPLLNFPIIKHIIEYTEQHKNNKQIDYTIATNLTVVNDEIIDLICKYNIVISTSLDGSIQVHDKNRAYPNGNGSYKDVVFNIDKLCSKNIKIGITETTTKYSLDHYTEIIDTYCNLGIKDVFIRPLTPLGCAKNSWDIIGYTPEEFLEFYKNILLYIIQKNSQNIIMSEGYASIFLANILKHFPMNYMELQSPCGASLGEIAYYPDGNIFTCDEGRMLYEMGDDAFKLGNVYDSTYNDLIHSPVCCTACRASITESIPQCCDCVYRPYCGVCPVVNYSMEHDIFPKYPNNYRCKIYSGMLDILFEIIQDKEKLDILNKWAIV